MTGEILIERVFAAGSMIILEYVDAAGTVKNCRTRVEDLEGNYLVLQTPVIDNAPVKFRESQELTLKRLDDSKQEAYVTNVFVIDVRQGKIPLLVCSKPKKVDRTSLRRFSRFDVDLPLKYTPSGTPSGTDGEDYVRDISLSGCYAVLNPDPEVKTGADLMLTITIPGEAEFTVSGRVIRTDPHVESKTIGAAVEFYNISDTIQEILYNYIFQLQLTSDTILGTTHRED
ncbi:MAG: flagellar brake protein [Dethiobacteria bacterium]